MENVHLRRSARIERCLRDRSHLPRWIVYMQRYRPLNQYVHYAKGFSGISVMNITMHKSIRLF
ncbi:hypothetical protein CANCADRAFT_32342 [Tortispora caseinolytica NRRL Y-17796]|uniref:Uncharacterized protein n=1 Tax=Tortispora caseinolytica NRRL Y-17796 TaxID=767744 RepID=A0A1E4TAY3_9ASCO|nr:hypothetical protein CANCADRAFT_32342 [Tortispora caseinolytica NRRL Y-17796]